MKLGEKLRYLRLVEGTLRGLEREMSQAEVARAIRKERGESISQAYLSQIESGARPHMTNTTRMLLARFFKVHPGYLVGDPDGFHTELTSEVSTLEDKLDLWLVQGAERFRRDPQVSRALLALAKHSNSRRCLVLMREILETPNLAERLLQVLKPERHPRRRRAAAGERGGRHELGGLLSGLFRGRVRLSVLALLRRRLPLVGRARRSRLHLASHGALPGHGVGDAAGHGASVSPFNFATLMAFLAWFGGMGYLLTGRSHLGELLDPGGGARVGGRRVRRSSSAS